MPYRLSPAWVSFQRLIDKVIMPEMEPCDFSYLDEVIIATETFEDILVQLKQAGLTIILKKSVLVTTEVKYVRVL